MTSASACHRAERALAIKLLPRDRADERAAMLEVRAGTGGDEAALFAGDLLRMYQRYAEAQGWRFELISASPSEMGGYKEAIASISGPRVFAKLKFESGVHRVQRVPVTESGGRIHTRRRRSRCFPRPRTSTSTSTTRICGSTSTARRAPVDSQSTPPIARSGLPICRPASWSSSRTRSRSTRTRPRALKVLRARLFELERDRLASERAGARKSMVGSGDRSERIRTYNFPQGRITDHRINLTLHKLGEVLEGPGLGEIVDALAAEDEAQRLAGLDEA
jgi:peptide chain release factor 1